MASSGACTLSKNGCCAANKPVPEAAALVVTFKPQLLVPAHKTDEAVLFYKAAFNAEELRREAYPKRKAAEQSPRIVCAELQIGGTSLIICDQTYHSFEAPVKEKVVGTGRLVLRLEADDVQAATEKAVKAGAVEVKGETVEEGQCIKAGFVEAKGEAVKEGQFVSKDSDEAVEEKVVAIVKDPFGFIWTIVSTSKVSDEAASA